MASRQPPHAAEKSRAACLVIMSPAGGQQRVRIGALPFRIGRLGDNELVLRDSRASRHHARIVAEGADLYIEDLNSSYGVFVNGDRVRRRKLHESDRIDFGFADSYHLVFGFAEGDAPAAAETPAAPRQEVGVIAGGSLAKLRAMLEVARALETSLSTDEVLCAVVEAALTVTGCERGFLLLRKGDDLEIRVARSRTGALAASDLRIPTRLLSRALNQRHELLSMNFDASGDAAAGRTIADLELRSIVCVPLVRIRAGSVEETARLSPAHDTTGLLYMDSRARNADLSSGGRELLTTLALEASTVLENARLLEQQWARQRMEQELRIARQIQESLLPRALPASGWFRAAGSSIPSLHVGGDYFDVRQATEDCWAAVVTDVSGKGVGAALLAALLQGMFLTSPYMRMPTEEMFRRVNRYLNERTGGEQYATTFYFTVRRDGTMQCVNAGHPPALVAHSDGRLESIPANGMPLGMLDDSVYVTEAFQLAAGDKLVAYTDGLTDARNTAGEFFGIKRLRAALRAAAGRSAAEVHAAIISELSAFTRDTPQSDDVTLAVIEYQPEG